jgi:glycosyltransferase involved in cell wall biosynthesis
MKVLLVAPMSLSIGPVGGMGSVTENMIHFIKKNSNDIDLIFYNTVHKIRSITSRSLFVRLFTGIMNSLETYFKVLRLIKNDKPDVIHLASSSSYALLKDYLIVKASNRLGIPIVMHWHFGRVPDLIINQNWEWKVFKSVIQNNTVSIVIDKRSHDCLNKAGFSNVVYIPNPLALDVEQKANESSINVCQRPPNRLIYVGHVIKEKGVFELVSACSLISMNIELELIGSYDEDIKVKLSEIAYHKDQGKWLRFIGQQKKDQVLETMRNSPILVLPSYTEGFPMVIIEAMAMGCAIIATHVGAIPEILAITSDTPCGICVSPKNPEELQEAITALVQDPSLIEVMGKRGIESALSNYNPEIIINEYIKIWLTVACKSLTVIDS